MSYVTSVTIVVDGAWDQTFIKAIEKPVDLRSDGGFEVDFRELDMHAAGGSKYPGHRVWAAGINHCDRETLQAWADTLPWQNTDGGVLLVDTEGDFREVWVYQVDEVKSVKRRGRVLDS